jgi:hypothetical protein
LKRLEVLKPATRAAAHIENMSTGDSWKERWKSALFDSEQRIGVCVVDLGPLIEEVG